MKKKIRSIFLLFLGSSLLQASETLPVHITLDSILVNEVYANQNKTSQTASKTIIDAKQLEQSGAHSVLSALKGAVPGMNITERNTMGYGIYTGAAGGISLRGMGGSPMTQVQIAVDGVPQMMGIHGHHIPDEYGTEGLERIEVQRGPASLQYGSNAMGGVINLVTRDRRTEGFGGRIQAEAGSYNTHRINGRMEARHKDLSGWIAGSRGQTDGHRPHADFDQWSGSGKLAYRVSPHWNVAALAQWTDFRSLDPGSLHQPAQNDSLLAEVMRYSTQLQVNNHYDHSQGHLRLFYNGGNHALYDGWNSDDYNLGLLAQQSFTLHTNHRIHLGIEQRSYGGQAFRTNNSAFHLDQWMHQTAAFTQIQQHWFNRRLLLEGGVRWDNNSSYGSEWIPQIGAGWQFSPAWKLVASHSKGYRNPTLRELFVVMPNAELKPEQLIQTEASLVHHASNNRFFTELTAYHVQGDNQILPINTNGVLRYQNTGSIENRGIDIQLRYAFKFPLSISGNYSYLHQEKRTAGTATHQWSLQANQTYKQHNLHVQWMHLMDYCSAQNTTDFSTLFLLDARYRYQIHSDLAFSLSGNNLLNKPIEWVKGYPTPGIRVTAGIDLRF